MKASPRDKIAAALKVMAGIANNTADGVFVTTKPAIEDRMCALESELQHIRDWCQEIEEQNP